ncbi:hypothetical protein WOLCODRAFT_166828 [Wolfiporia cocos MD-104 SS10]|uniref:BTB domain-containing protein n=1 Tax=Wolfiporia cocos (strain MD-104) TaxID=742152 RepID=A0A2H3J237_WOLCO|nr:hypothetical protein WOLCODRAFT_166828 [Wolfiporia cocos MD-104 SS10]
MAGCGGHLLSGTGLAMGTHRFAPQSTTDVILASSDNIAFFAHASVLSELSPVFNAMFSQHRASKVSGRISRAPTVSSNTAGEHAVLHMPDSSSVLEILLSLCYPDLAPAVSRLSDLRGTLDAASRLRIVSAIDWCRERLLGFAQYGPLQVFALACRHKFEDVAFEAAKEICAQEIIYDVLYPTYSELPHEEGFTAGALWRLAKFGKKEGVVPQPYSFIYPPEERSSTSDAYNHDPILSSDTNQFNSADADVILRTSDGADFRVHKVVIDEASKVLSAMIDHVSASFASSERHPRSLRQRRHIPIINLGEQCDIVALLLQLYYPSTAPLSDDV